MKTTVAAPLKVGTPLRRRPFLSRAIFVTVALSIVIIQLHAADTLTESLQKGLFEEEANHNLDAAIKAYQDVLSRADEQRRVAATALFRLAECYRKQGKTNEATAEYRRLLRDYADQSTLATLSRQNLAGLGASAPAVAATSDAASTDEEEQELRRIKALIKNSPDLINAKNRDLGGGLTVTLLHEAAAKGQLLVAEYLLANGAQIDSENSQRITPLYYAARAGHKRVVELLLAKGANPNGAPGGPAPLQVAAEKGFRGVAEVLLTHKADVNGGGSGRTPLHEAVSAGHLSIAELLIERGANVNADASNDDQRANLLVPDGTPLHFAVQLRKPNFIRLLLEKGANPNARSSRGLNPLHYSAHLKDRETAQILIEHKAEVDARAEAFPYRGWSPLLIAVFNTATNVVELLLEKGANPNVVAETQVGQPTPVTPLHLALEKQSLGIAKLLLDRGADVNARPKKILSVLFIAIQKNDVDMVNLLLRYKPDLNAQAYEGTYTPLLAAVVDKKFDIAELLLKSGADPNVTNSAGNAAIHRAVDAYERNVPVTAPVPGVSVPTRAIRQPERSPEPAGKQTKSLLELLLDYKADPNLRNGEGNTPLQLAVRNSKIGAVELLLARNADPNASGKDGDKALHFAVRAGLSDGATEITRLLLEKKADANATNSHGATPLHHISARPNTNTLALLVKHGADVNACDSDRETPLHKILKAQGLAYEDTEKGVRFLLEHGTDVLRNCAGGVTPFYHEQHYGARSAIIELLRSYLPKKYAGIRITGPVEPRFWFWEPDQKLTLSELFKSVALQEKADPRRITIWRDDPGTGLKRTETHNLIFIREKITPDVPVQDGDKIDVASRSN